MPTKELSTLSLDELKQLQKDVAKAIDTFEARQKADAHAKLEALARDLGFSLSELANLPGKAKKGPVPAKYRDPENPAVTWSGRGRRPKWFMDAKEKGLPDEALLID